MLSFRSFQFDCVSDHPAVFVYGELDKDVATVYVRHNGFFDAAMSPDGHTAPPLFLRLLERHRLVRTVVAAKQDLDFALCFVQTLLALARQADPLLEQLERTVQRQIASFEVPHDLLKLFKRRFKTFFWCHRHFHIL